MVLVVVVIGGGAGCCCCCNTCLLLLVYRLAKPGSSSRYLVGKLFCCELSSSS